jgi:hypothetical protein
LVYQGADADVADRVSKQNARARSGAAAGDPSPVALTRKSNATLPRSLLLDFGI